MEYRRSKRSSARVSGLEFAVSHRFAAKTPEGRSAQLANLKTRTPTHGTQSTVLLQPLIEQAEQWARAQWPFLTDARLHLVALLAAKVERVRLWAAGNDITRPGR